MPAPRAPPTEWYKGINPKPGGFCCHVPGGPPPPPRGLPGRFDGPTCHENVLVTFLADFQGFLASPGPPPSGGAPPGGLPGRCEGTSFPRNASITFSAASSHLGGPQKKARAPGWQIHGTRASRAGPRGQPMKSSATKQAETPNERKPYKGSKIVHFAIFAPFPQPFQGPLDFLDFRCRGAPK